MSQQGMKSARAIKAHLDTVAVHARIPCNCPPLAHQDKCNLERIIAQNVIAHLMWVLGENPALEEAIRAQQKSVTDFLEAHNTKVCQFRGCALLVPADSFACHRHIGSLSEDHKKRLMELFYKSSMGLVPKEEKAKQEFAIMEEAQGLR